MANTLSISTRLPQGSVLGPLFIIYINDVANASRLFMSIRYADDTTLSHISSYFGNTDDKVTFDNNLHMELNKISDKLKFNKLSINVNKTKFHDFP